MDDFVQDAKSLTNLLDCIQGMYQLIQQFDWKTAQTMIPKEVQGLIQQIPNLMEKAKTFGGKDLVLLSVYLGYRSIELYDRANSLKIDFKPYQQEFDLLKQKLKPMKEFLDAEIVPQWKNGKIVNMPRNTEKYIEMLNRYSEVLRKLVHAIYSDVKQGSRDRIWSVTYGVAAVGVCVWSLSSLGILWYSFLYAELALVPLLSMSRRTFLLAKLLQSLICCGKTQRRCELRSPNIVQSLSS